MNLKIYELPEKTMICPLHGPYEFNPIVWNGEIIYAGCPDCINGHISEKEAGKEYELLNVEYEKRQKEMNIGRIFWDTSFNIFDAYTDELKAHLKTAMDFSKNPTGKLVMLGSNGTGKNHLAVSILKKTGGVIYTAFEIGLMLRRSYNGDSKEWEVLKELCEVKLLVIDEIGRTKGSDWELNWLSHVINKRHENLLPLILISNRHLTHDCTQGGCQYCLERYFENDVVSRIVEDGIILKFTGDDYRYKKRRDNFQQVNPAGVIKGAV